MTERIDHTAESVKHIDWVHEWQSEAGDMEETNLANALIAQAEATLALVEQQRIANLIALSQGTHPNGQRYADHIHHPIDDYAVAMNGDIREALNLWPLGSKKTARTEPF